VVKPEGRRPLGISRRRWGDNTQIGLRNVDWSGRDLFDVAQDRDQWSTLVNTVINLTVP
jgi:hypothetical protein